MSTVPTLSGRHARLRPMQRDDLEALATAASPGEETFRWYPTAMHQREVLSAWVEAGVDEAGRGTALPFVIERLADGQVVGATRLFAIESAHRRAEIGHTWLGPAARRTAINTECKRLLLAHGFEAMGLNRIEFKTDSLNAASRAALARIGATQEGVFRNHIVTHTGRLRHSVWFSVIVEEWPQVRDHLDGLLARTATAA